MVARRTKLTIITDKIDPLNEASIIRIRALMEALLDSKKFQLMVFSTSRMAPTGQVIFRRLWARPPSNRTGAWSRGGRELLLTLEIALRMLFHRTDLIFVSSPPFLLASMCGILAGIKDLPYVLDVRDPYPAVYFMAGVVDPTSLLAKILTWLEKRTCRCAFLVTAATLGLKSDLEKRLGRRDVYLLTNGYLDAALPENTGAKDRQPFTVIFHGNLGQFQDVNLLLNLARRSLSDGYSIRWLVIGRGSKETILRQGAPSNVEYHEMMEITEVYRRIIQAHVGVSFRTNDPISVSSFPVKVYEYIGLGLPMIITPKSEAGDFVAHHGIGFQFQPDDQDRIYKQLLELYQHPHLLRELQINMQAMKDRFSRARINSEFVSFLSRRISQDNQRTLALQS